MLWSLVALAFTAGLAWSMYQLGLRRGNASSVQPGDVVQVIDVGGNRRSMRIEAVVSEHTIVESPPTWCPECGAPRGHTSGCMRALAEGEEP